MTATATRAPLLPVARATAGALIAYRTSRANPWQLGQVASTTPTGAVEWIETPEGALIAAHEWLEGDCYIAPAGQFARPVADITNDHADDAFDTIEALRAALTPYLHEAHHATP